MGHKKYFYLYLGALAGAIGANLVAAPFLSIGIPLAALIGYSAAQCVNGEGKANG